MAGEERGDGFCHFPNTDDLLTTLQCAGQPSEVVWRHVESFDDRPLLISEGHELPKRRPRPERPARRLQCPRSGWREL